MRPLALVLALLLVPGLVHADERWTLSGDVRALQAPVLPGVVVGGALQGRRTLAGPWRLSLLAGLGNVADSNETWDISQTHLYAAAGLGLARQAGAAQLSLDVQAGAMVVLEDARRHQFERLSAANVPDRERTSTMTAPFAQLELAAAVELAPRWRLRLAAGPQLLVPTIDDARTVRLGLFTAAGVEHAF